MANALNNRLIAAVYVGSLGGFIFGYDLGALSAVTESLRGQFHLASGVFGLTVSSSIWGTVCGSVLAGPLAKRTEWRKLLSACALLYACAAATLVVPGAPHLWLVLVMRFLCGMAIGGFTVVCPLYLSEIAPPRMRGKVVAMFQVQVGAGVILAFCCAAFLLHRLPHVGTWKLCLGLGAVPALLLCFLARSKSRNEVAKSAAVANAGHSEPVDTGKAMGGQRLFQRRNTRVILIATSLAVFNQLSGVNILLLYMLEILRSAGIGLSLGHIYTVVISCLGLLTTLTGMAFVDRLGRKPLLKIGAVGMAVCLLLLGLTIPQRHSPALYLFLLIAYNAFFAFSQGTVVWVYLSELFPPGLRSLGQGYGASVHWVANALLILVFPRVHHASGVEVFYVLAAMMVLQAIVIAAWYPETKGTALGIFDSPEGDGGIRRRLPARDRLHTHGD